MQYRHEIGARSRYARPCVGRDCIHWYSTLRSSIGMKSSTLPLTSPCSGTKRKTTVPLFFASTGGLRLLSFIPILLLSLQLIKFYSPSLRRFASTHGLRLPLLQTYTASVALAYWFLQSFASQVCKYRQAQIAPLSCLFCNRFSLLISTVLRFAGLQVPTGSGCPSYRPILHQSLDFVDCLVLLTPLCQIATYIYQ